MLWEVQHLAPNKRRDLGKVAALVARVGGWGSVYQTLVESFVCVTQRLIAVWLHFCAVTLDRLMATLMKHQHCF